jgi:hypothetical protein
MAIWLRAVREGELGQARKVDRARIEHSPWKETCINCSLQALVLAPTLCISKCSPAQPPFLSPTVFPALESYITFC